MFISWNEKAFFLLVVSGYYEGSIGTICDVVSIEPEHYIYLQYSRPFNRHRILSTMLHAIQQP